MFMEVKDLDLYGTRSGTANRRRAALCCLGSTCRRVLAGGSSTMPPEWYNHLRGTEGGFFGSSPTAVHELR